MAIRVNGVEIADQAIDAEVQHHPSRTLDQARRQAAEALVLRELLMQEAARRGVEPEAAESSEEGLLQALLAAELDLPEADEATCRRYYEANRRRFHAPDLYEGAHILFAAAPEDRAARAEALAKAKQAIAQLQQAPDDFAMLASLHSDCPSGKTAGHLGQVKRGDLVDELETFLFALEEGQLCPIPVQTRHGWHVVRLDRKIGGRQLPFELARERIAEYLRESAWRRAASQYLRILAGRAEIDGLQIDAAATPLVQ